MRPRKHETTGSGDLFRARLDQIINMRHELVWNCNTVCDRAFFAQAYVRPVRRRRVRTVGL